MSQSDLSKIEQGERWPSLAQLTRLGQALDLPIQWFMTGTLRPGNELDALAPELHALGVVDLLFARGPVPGAFRAPEATVALALSGNSPDPRIVEAIPAVLAWNPWNAFLLDAYGRSYDARAVHRLAWLADVTLTINGMHGFPGGCIDPFALAELVRRILPSQDEDGLGRPSTDGRLPPVSKRWRITYAADLTTFQQRAENLREMRSHA